MSHNAHALDRAREPIPANRAAVVEFHFVSSQCYIGHAVAGGILHTYREEFA